MAIGVAVADSPTGPFKDALGNKAEAYKAFRKVVRLCRHRLEAVSA